jgi:hypothetical protein
MLLLLFARRLLARPLLCAPMDPAILLPTQLCADALAGVGADGSQARADTCRASEDGRRRVPEASCESVASRRRQSDSRRLAAALAPLRAESRGSGRKSDHLADRMAIDRPVSG